MREWTYGREAAGGVGQKALPLLVEERRFVAEESCTVAVAERLDARNTSYRTMKTINVGVGGFFQVCAVGDEFVAVLDVSVLATGRGQ